MGKTTNGDADEYTLFLHGLDREGRIPFRRSEESDGGLAGLLVQMKGCDKGSADMGAARQAIDDFYDSRLITVRTVVRLCDELEKTREGRAFLLTESATAAFICEMVAAASATVGAYDIAGVCFAAGVYEIYNAIRLAGKNDG